MNFVELVTRWNKGVRRGAQTRFAKALRVSQPTIARWASGDILPSEEMRSRVAKELAVTVEELMDSFPAGGQGRPRRRTWSAPEAFSTAREASPGYGRPSLLVPVVGYVHSEPFPFAFEEFPKEYLPIAMQAPQERKFAALGVVGSGLEPAARDGDYVIIAEAQHIEPGKTALVRREGRYSFKRIQKKGESAKLDRESLAGVVVGFFRKPS